MEQVHQGGEDHGRLMHQSLLSTNLPMLIDILLADT